MRKCLLLTILVAAWCVACLGTAAARPQNDNGADTPRQISGSVYDSLSLKPLAGAAVTLMRGGKAVSFVNTGSDGSFEIKAMRGDRLQATFLGYMKKSVTVGSEQKIDIAMAQRAFTLKEVQVKGTPVFGRQDTTVFDLKRFADERDYSLTDVLKKLPGVNVDGNGKISFNGKDISRFTVESLDLTGGRYNKLTEALKRKTWTRRR